MKVMTTLVSGDSSGAALEKSTTWLPEKDIFRSNAKYKVIQGVDLWAFPKIIFGGAFLGILGFATQDTVKWSSLFTQAPIAKEIPAQKIQFETIDLADALKLFYSKDVVFLDAREKKYFDYGSIRGAENLDPEKIGSISLATLKRWKEKSAVVVYCNGVSCGASFYAARQLIEQGIDNVKVYAKGWPEWKSCHLPMTMSQAMMKEEAGAHEESN